MELVPNVLKNEDQKNLNIGDTGVTWGIFREEINKIIIDLNEGFTSSQDKQLGGWFIRETSFNEIIDSYTTGNNDGLIEKIDTLLNNYSVNLLITEKFILKKL